MKKIIIFLMFILCMISVIAVPPFQSSSTANTNTLQIEYPKFDIFPLTDINYNVHVYSPNGTVLTNLTTSCILDLYNYTGHEIYEQQMIYSSYYFYSTIPSSVLTDKRHYSVVVQCNQTNIGGFISTPFYINKEGNKEEPSSIIAVIILLPVIFAVMFLFMAFSLGDDHTILRIGLFLLSFSGMFLSVYIGTLSIIEYYDFPEMQDLMGDLTYIIGIIFFTMLVYICIYLIAAAIHMAAQKKKEARLRY